MLDYRLLPPGRQRGLEYIAHVNRSRIPTLIMRRLLELEYPAPSGLIAKVMLTNTNVENSKGVSFCVICQDRIHRDDIIRILGCKHGFHIGCIDMWLTDKQCCPTCKGKVQSKHKCKVKVEPEGPIYICFNPITYPSNLMTFFIQLSS